MIDMKARTFAFAVNVGKLVGELPRSAVNNAYTNQIVRCSSSVGANYRAARRAKSDADFLNKLKIVEEEADETIYFLELLNEFNKELNGKFVVLINEGTEILKIIVASINTTKEKINNLSKEKNKK
jgi:four helix bundle protein